MESTGKAGCIQVLKVTLHCRLSELPADSEHLAEQTVTHTNDDMHMNIKHVLNMKTVLVTKL
jgi:hypothetical protein